MDQNLLIQLALFLVAFLIPVGGWIREILTGHLSDKKKRIYVGSISGGAVLIVVLLVVLIIRSQPLEPLPPTEIPDHITSEAPSYPNGLAKVNGWLELPNNPDGSCQFLTDGGYKVTIKNTFNAFFKCPSSISLTNFALQVQMRFLSGSEGGILMPSRMLCKDGE